MHTLQSKVIHGFLWISLYTFISRAISLVTTVLLARLLLPSDFGLMAIALIIINAMQLVYDLGFGQALIYFKQETQERSSTAFFLILFMSIGLYLIGYLISPFVARFFKYNEINTILKILSLSIPLTAIGIVPSTLLEKELEFHKKFFPEILPPIGYFLVSTGLAVAGYGVWSLVLGQIFRSFLGSFLIWFFSSWRPSFQFNKQFSSELLKYGKHVVGASLAIFVFVNLDKAFVGRILDATSLGYYSLAFNLNHLLPFFVAQLIGKVTFPAFSIIQEDLETFRKNYLRIFKVVSTIIVPLGIGIAIFASEIVTFLLGSKWIPAIDSLRILSFYGLIGAIGASTASVFYASGKVSWVYWIAIAQLFPLLSLGYFVTNRFGIAGMSCLMTASIGISQFVSLKKVGNILSLKMTQYLLLLKYPIFCVVVSGIASKSIQIWVFQNMNLIEFITCSLIFSGIYISLIFIFDPSLRSEIKALFFLRSHSS